MNQPELIDEIYQLRLINQFGKFLQAENLQGTFQKIQLISAEILCYGLLLAIKI